MNLDDLHDRVVFLQEEIAHGRFEIRSPLTLRALAKVKFDTAGRVDPSTVTSEVRAVALAAAAMRQEQEIRQTSLKDIQQAYFDFLERFFGPAFSDMKKYGLNPQQTAQQMVASEKFVSAFAEESREFAGGIQDFWELFGPVVEEKLRSSGTLKAVFGGDVFPSYTANIACSVGLYADTIVLPDPVHRLSTFVDYMQPKELLRLTCKHALNALSYRELALADLDVPIVVFAPDYLADDTYRKRLMRATEPELIRHFSKVFGKGFDTVKALRAFLEPHSKAEDLMSLVADSSRMLFNTEWSGTPLEQFERYSSEALESFEGAPNDPRKVLELSAFGRFMQSNDAVSRSERFGGSPLIDAPTSWQYLLWKYEYGSVSRWMPDVSISNALALEGSEHGMLSGLPASVLIELRRNGAASDLREVLCKGIAEIDSVAGDTVDVVGKQVIENVDNAFAEHEKRLKAVSSARSRFFGLDVSRYLVVGGLTIAAAKWPSLSMLAAVATQAGQPSPVDLAKRFREIRSETAQLRRSPTGIMFKHLKKNFGFSS